MTEAEVDGRVVRAGWVERAKEEDGGMEFDVSSKREGVRLPRGGSGLGLKRERIEEEEASCPDELEEERVEMER